MTYRDDPQSPVPNPQHAMVGSPRTSDALVPHTNGMPPAALYPVSPMPPAQDVLRGGMDANSFLNCLRRRWLLAVCMGLVMAGAAATALWFLFPESSSAMALFSVSSSKPSLLGNEGGSEIREYEILQRTQLA